MSDKPPRDLAKEVYLTIIKNTEPLDGEGLSHAFYLLGAILTGSEIDVNLSDDVGDEFLRFMESRFPDEHQVWNHIDFSTDGDYEDYEGCYE